MNLLDLIPAPFRLAIGASVAIAAVGTAVVWLHGRESAADARGYARGHAEAVALRADYETKAAGAAEDYRQREAALQARATTAEERYAALQPQHARLLVAQRDLLAERGQLRNAIAAYAAGSGGAAPDTAAAASERAAALGGLLAEALRADAESAAAAEGNADAVRAILAAWPSDGAAVKAPATP